jgi:cobalt-zinc-cadmium efflux system outer membrane protein
MRFELKSARLVLLAVLSTLATAVADETVWSVEALVQRALVENAELRFYEAAVAAAKGERTQAGLWKNPEASGELGERRIRDGAGNLSGEGTTVSVSVTQTFEFPGKGSLRKAVADRDVVLAELGLKQFRAALEGKVRLLALRHGIAAAEAESAAEVMERVTALVALLRERPVSGSARLLELRVIEASLIDLRKAARESAQELEETRIELNQLLGLPQSERLKIDAPFHFPSLREGGLNALILAGLSNNLQLRIRTVELEKAVKQVSSAHLEVAPDFSVGPFFSRDRADGKEENFGATVSVTLPVWNWNQGNIAVARARREQADALLLDARRKVEAEIARRYRSFEAYRRELEQTDGKLIEQLREASDLADRQYRTGAIEVTLFLEVQRAFLQAQRIRHEAQAGIWSDWMDLQLLTGSPCVPSPPKASP